MHQRPLYAVIDLTLAMIGSVRSLQKHENFVGPKFLDLLRRWNMKIPE